ncbi:MAG: rRNA pseudouridine synthase [Clostridia bacterium]|nr:rRNA pseudouridine synthase [Clostridia bacterium]
MALVRIQKILSDRGVASRRKAEELIAQGVVKVNGHPARLGDKADDRRDRITVHGKLIAGAEKPLYLMLHKPRGYITTLSDEKGRKCVADLVADAGARVFPVGRLDKDSEGLLLMTNDGDFANAMMHPTAHLPKRYRVTVRAEVKEEQLLKFREGMMLEGKKTLPADADIITATPAKDEAPPRTVLDIVLYEGRNRQIRKMCEQLGLEVIRLKRVAMADVKLGMLPVGQWRHLDPKEVRALVMASKTTQKIAADYIKNGRVETNVRNTSRRRR